VTTVPGFSPAPTSGGMVSKPSEAASSIWVRKIADVLNNMLRGKLNVVLPVTLRFGHITTDVIDARIGPYSGLLLQELTASAAAAKFGAPYILPSDQNAGQVTLNHTTISSSDVSFNLIIIG